MIINCALFHDSIIKYNIGEITPFKKYGFWSLKLGKLCRYFNLQLGNNINRDVIKIKDDIIIFFDAGLTNNDPILDIIARENKGKRLIFYYWNPVSSSILPSKIPNEYEKWTYSYSDSVRYELNYNPTFYCTKIFCEREEHSDILWDVIFIGSDKGRLKQLSYWKRLFEKNNLNTYLYITATHPRIQRWGYKKFIPYDQTLKLIKESKCILDLYLDVKAGLSLRVMEALFLEKKLITNNITIFLCDFYNSDNIFVLGVNDMSRLYDFVNAPYRKIAPSILDKYKFENWLKRF